MMIGGTAVIVVIGTFFAKSAYDKNPSLLGFASGIQPAATLQNPEAKDINTDTDGDGLKDWEEKLWKTDPTKSDTDMDGTPDGKEIQEGRDPTVPNTQPPGETPSDVMQKQTIVKRIIENSGDTSLNATDKFAREFFSQYLDSTGGAGDGSLSDADKQKMVASLSAEEGASPLTYKHYSAADIQMNTDGSQTAIRAYGNALGKIISEHSISQYDNELATLQTALQSQNKDLLKNLDPIIANLQAITTLSLKTPVPPTAQDLQVNFLNALQELSQSIANMKPVFDDPLTSLKALSLYSEAQANLAGSVSALISYFKANGIVWTKDEYGFAFRVVQ